MALLTDEGILTPEDLRKHESGIYEVATAEGIDLTQKLALAQEGVRGELGAILFADAPDAAGGVVVTPALQRWIEYHCLALVYRDAYGSHLNERYEKKWRAYEQEATWARRRLLETGAGVVDFPVPKAAAPKVTGSPSAAGGAAYWIRTAWVNGQGEEGAPSEAAVYLAPENTAPVVDPGDAPAAARGWNLYAGPALEDCWLQNAAPLEAGQLWTMPEWGLRMGRKPGTGQAPNRYVRLRRVLPRG